MMFFLLIWSLCALGFFALASSMDKHQKQIYQHTLTATQTHLATFSGWLLLIIALVICLFNGPTSNMISYWVGVLTFAALLIGVCMSYYANHLKKVAMGLVGLTLISLILYLL